MKTPVTYVPKFLEFPNVAFKSLWDELDWERRENTPRREYYCNDYNVPYVYGTPPYHREYFPKVWHDWIMTIRAKIEKFTGIRFDTCFLNGYENQKDHLGWHSDNSPEMDDSRPIAIVSLGVEREIWFRPLDNTFEVEKLLLQNGSLCLMNPGMQDTHQHRIPKAGFECGERISLTYRGYVEQ